MPVSAYLQFFALEALEDLALEALSLALFTLELLFLAERLLEEVYWLGCLLVLWLECLLDAEVLFFSMLFAPF